MKRVLVVAGHDPSGAGIDADRAALAELDVEAVCVTTAFTKQDAHAVRSIGARDSEEWLAEALHAAREGIDALKFGLLPGAAHVQAAAHLWRELRTAGTRWCVVDPVLAASSGSRFLDAEAVELLRTELFAAGPIVTPNVLEAAELAHMPLARLEAEWSSRAEAAETLLALGVSAVVLKGGHGREDPVRDLVFAAGGAPHWLTHARTQGGKIRGSGCRFASRLAGELALGTELAAAAERAGRAVAERIARTAR